MACKKNVEKLNILLGLQKLTGHYFEPDPEIWKEWYESERPDLLEAATARKREILGDAHPGHIAPEVDAAIRSRFAIHLENL